MDVLDSSPAPLRAAPLVIGVALALLAVAQTGALTRTPGLPSDVGLRAEQFGYAFTTEGDRASVVFHLTHRGKRPLEVLAVGRDGPGLELVDVVASGEAVGFRAAGQDDALLPRFLLRPGRTVVLTLVYRATSCEDVPGGAFPVTLEVRDGRASDITQVALPRLPDDAEGAGPEDEVEWQRALVRDLCGSA